MKKTKTFKKLLSLVLVAALTFSLAACGKKEGKPESQTNKPESQGTSTEGNKDTLVYGIDHLSQKFSPFFVKVDYDKQAMEMTQLILLTADREGAPVLNSIEGETRAYNGVDYTYKGISDIDVKQNDDGSVDYDITLKEGLKFSDGTEVTIDDVIFSMYAFLDPTYDGSTSIYTMPIEGLEEYRSGMEMLSDLILAAGKDNTDFTKWTKEQQDKYWEAFDAAGAKFVQEIIDYCANEVGTELDEEYAGSNEARAMDLWGFGKIENGVLKTKKTETEFNLAEGKLPTIEDFWNEIVAEYGNDLSNDGINKEKAGTAIADLIVEELGDSADEFAIGITTGDSAESIKGIVKTGDYSLTIHCTEFGAKNIYNLGVYVAPMHYYGDKDLYDYDNNKFGFVKGDLSILRTKTTEPMGAGPYKYVSFQNGVLTFEANENYYKGEPKTKTILFQEVNEGDKLSGVISGSFDVVNPAISREVVESIKGYNSNNELSGDVIETNMVDNLGYGYIGIAAERVRVGSDNASEESKNLRKGFATLFSVYRDTVVNSYYGDLASVIQYPISNTSWAAPRPADEGYQIAYSTDVEGKQIYTDTMTDDEKYAAAIDATVGYLKAAGYTWDEATGKFTAAPEGAKMTYEIMIPANGEGDHPSYGVISAVKDAFAGIGITLEIKDVSDGNLLWTALEAVPVGTDMWVAAWQAVVDPDMYQVYHSSNVNGAGGTESNHYYVADAELDKLIMDALKTADQAVRKATYKEALEIIMSWAVEVPVYQRQNAILLSSDRVNLDTVTPDITTFWDWMNDIELVEMK